MKKLNWQKVTKQVATKDGTIWMRAAIPQSPDTPTLNISPAEVEELFSIQEIVKKKAEKQEKKSSIVTLLDPQSSFIVNIFLKQFKMPNAKIIAILSEGDCSRITSDQLKVIQKVLPDKNTVSVPLFVLYIYQLFRLSIQSIDSIYLSIYLSVCQSVCPSVYLSMYQLIDILIHQSIH